MNIFFEGRSIGENRTTFFIADISANHDGNLLWAIDLIYEAAEAGADAAKFQNFQADTIVSNKGFDDLGKKTHQAAWKKSVYDVFEAASIPLDWIPTLKEACNKAGIVYFTTPYSLEIVDKVDPFVSLYKIGSGDINYTDLLLKIAAKHKPIFLATGASDMIDVLRAVRTIESEWRCPDLVVMQCNTNYTNSPDNFKYVNLRVIETYLEEFPNYIIGLSDHTPGHSAVLGAVALGAKVIEKHFTDDRSREGPDHAFSMMPDEWREMVKRTRELEFALGSRTKVVSENEKESKIVQRRCIRAARDIKAGEILSTSNLSVLRPAPPDSIEPSQLPKIIGKKVTINISSGTHLTYKSIE